MSVARSIVPVFAIVFATIVCSSPPAYALAPSRSITQYRLDVWTRDHGLPQNSIQAITQTSDGYLWVGTQQGLARFDGVRFTVFNRRNTEVLKDDYVSTLLSDREGILWIGTERGLYSYRDGRFTAHPAEHIVKGVVSLFEDRGGTVWVGAREGPLGILRDGEVHPFTDTDGTMLADVAEMAQDREGRLCFATRRFHCLEDGRFRAYDISALTLRNRKVTSVAADGEGRFWLGTLGDGLIEQRDGVLHGKASGPGGPGAVIFRLFVDRAGDLWIGTDATGLIRRRGEGFEVLSAAEGLSGKQVTAIYEDHEGSLWFGTITGGLNRLTDRRFTPFSVSEGLSHPYVHSVLEDRTGAVWVGTAAGLNRIVNRIVTRFSEKDGLTNQVILGLWEDLEGGIWIGTGGGGLLRFRQGRFTAYPTPPGVVFAIYQDHEGMVWAGSPDGLYLLDGDRFVPVDWAAGFGMVSSITEDPRGNLWMGAFRRGLVRYANETPTLYSTENGLGDNGVLGIHADDEGVIWFATHGGGLHRLENDTITVYTMNDGLPCQTLFWILEDDNGSLWVTCNDGVFSVSKQQLNDVAAGQREVVEAVLYGTGDGMRNSECNGGQQPAGWKGADGRLWLPTGDGLVSIDPRNIRRNAVPPPVVLERILVDDVALDGTASKRVFPPGQGRLQFDYTGLSLLAPEKVRFRYRLEGFDNEWVEAGARRTAFYTNIPPGNYTFRVRAANNDGVWSETGAAFPFRLRPHYYQTLWFYTLVLATLGFAGYGVHRYRLARVLELERIRTRIATDLHDDIGASLSQIAILSEVLQQQKGRTDPDLDGPLSRIAASSRELIDSMSDIVWAVNPKRDRLRDVVQRMRRFASDTLSARDIELSFSAPQSEPDLRLGADIRRQVYLVFKESLNNAVRHSGCRRVEIELQKSAGSLTLSIRDDGSGFDPALDSDGNGLASIRRRAEELAGSLRIDSTPGRGTTVRLLVPLGRQNLPA
jgi:ligand-binding sensor domain-containing protein/two-component sensor histidine kinase